MQASGGIGGARSGGVPRFQPGPHWTAGLNPRAGEGFRKAARALRGAPLRVHVFADAGSHSLAANVDAHARVFMDHSWMKVRIPWLTCAHVDVSPLRGVATW